MADLSLKQITQSSKQRLLWIVLVILVFFLAAIWLWWWRQREVAALPSAQELGAIDLRFRELITLVETIHRVTLDTSILQDPRFSSLEHIPFLIEATPEESGRINPFAPLESSEQKKTE